MRAQAWLAGGLILTCGLMATASTLTRDADPVVLIGDDVNVLIGMSVGDFVAFRYDATWKQIPVQVDERKWVDFGVVYNEPPVGILTLAYADASTYCGADDNPTFDDDDELVFMAADAGEQAPGMIAPPAGVDAGSPALELTISDPIDGGIG